MMQTRQTEQIEIDDLSNEELEQVSSATMTLGEAVAWAILTLRATPAHMAKTL